MTAFKSIPPWLDFIKGRSSDMLRMRQRFVAKLDKMHMSDVESHRDKKITDAVNIPD